MSSRLTIVSALESECRRVACRRLLNADGVVLLEYTRLGPRRLARRISTSSGVRGARELCMGRGEAAYAVTADLDAALREILAEVGPVGDLVLGLPEGVDASIAVDVVTALDHPLTIDSVMTAVDPVTIEDLLWSSTTLEESDISAMPDDHRVLGEFVVGELSCADSCVLVPSAGNATRGELLIGHLCPQAWLTRVPGGSPVPAGRLLPPPTLRSARFDPREARSRLVPGAVVTPVVAETDGISTVICRARRPLHPRRLAERMHAIAQGCVWSRGRSWIASVPRCRVIWHGVGPQVGLEDGGLWTADRPAATPDDLFVNSSLEWDREYGDRGTVLAFTGEEISRYEIQELLDECVLTDRELTIGPVAWQRWEDPLALRTSFTEHVLEWMHAESPSHHTEGSP
ncbi:G3E family GTPase [Actinoalloteichus hoggarensis]|uniref:Putative metal chaperone YciC n=1 Tax=Actinoalloteichus hoggarensis TaxID=1470176 RepID=A0A221W4L9_9PSEU|nr:GTP-binding protein [Actinoalloteichus hoggarensis]ASO20596.1 Putative metal chaperone YciC [Actinoalloteichus hoggarensis]MBB5923637.1 G3E family GTPase [Actinoalloteichus hoggarensis]